MSDSFEPPPFQPRRWLANGHLQTIWQLRSPDITFDSTVQSQVDLADGDAIVLHDDVPVSWREDGLSVLLVHGLCGCHASPHMRRFANTLHGIGVRTFRMDMRGCGAALDLSRKITHAGRSADVLAALEAIAAIAPHSSLAVAGISLGGSQLLRAVGRVSAQLDERPSWWKRLCFAAAVSPPIDLRRCCERMQEFHLRPYNRHFIDHLLAQIPKVIESRDDIRAAIARRRPRTLLEFDEMITAPLNGFNGALDYYSQSSASPLLSANQIPTLIVAAQDDPIVPIECFTDIAATLPSSTRLLMPRHGGHVGFIDRSGKSWVDEVLIGWVKHVTRVVAL